MCDFCTFEERGQPVLRHTGHFVIVRNKFPYGVWDARTVTDHLLIVPKQHIESLSSFSASVAKEYLELLTEYEQQGYNVYARAPQAEAKSVPHQHTHLIQVEGPPKRFWFSAEKPRIHFAR